MEIVTALFVARRAWIGLAFSRTNVIAVVSTVIPPVAGLLTHHFEPPHVRPPAATGTKVALSRVAPVTNGSPAAVGRDIATPFPL